MTSIRPCLWREFIFKFFSGFRKGPCSLVVWVWTVKCNNNNASIGIMMPILTCFFCFLALCFCLGTSVPALFTACGFATGCLKKSFLWRGSPAASSPVRRSKKWTEDEVPPGQPASLLERFPMLDILQPSFPLEYQSFPPQPILMSLSQS